MLSPNLMGCGWWDSKDLHSSLNVDDTSPCKITSKAPTPWKMRVKKLEETRSGKTTSDIKSKQKEFAAHWLCAIWGLHMDAHGTLDANDTVTVGPCILKIHHQLIKIIKRGYWSNASLIIMALTWHSAPHKCAKFRSSRYSTPPRRQHR